MKNKVLISFIISIACFFGVPSNGIGQVLRTDSLEISNSILHIDLKEVKIKGRKRNKRKYYRSTRRYRRTIRNIRIVYPYAQMANQTIRDLNKELELICSKSRRRKLIRKEYKGLMKVYKKPMMKLKISQGKLLMKLIDRETGSSSYKHLQELKGSTTAFFWQAVASMFGTSLKSKYQPEGKDWMVEEILDRMRKGELSPPRKLRIKPQEYKLNTKRK
ncbi:DUF4294 domain-containing protein [Ancylomarina sp. 16SWW S1-10-2]|uniref:DUF4294 domain-containing protein n=1 Tax=Ancylomarina sp. 16SWW S1-10-2 TaxID=2499681 RepID=UPI0012AD510B|nr:DUF4294 domain-containing protein [Ancylomarina sp. 16SWW S1-10-2]MRT91757.1 DUF4294 domain-containing protein [Ancylomarina sp. 16SWW S1-10-2]